MKLLIIGRGWVGNKIYNELIRRRHLVSLESHEFKVSSWYDYVINCAGVTGFPNVDGCEFYKDLTISANAVFPILLYEQCNRLGIKFAHFSSGCIYQGVIDTVDMPPNYFGSTYSVSKGISDSYLKDKCLLFRIRMPFTKDHESKNLFTKLVNYSQNGKLCELGPNSITDLDEAVSVACDLIEKNAFGAYNLVNSGFVTNHELANILGLDAEWYDPKEFEERLKDKRSSCVIPSNAGMRCVYAALTDRVREFGRKV